MLEISRSNFDNMTVENEGECYKKERKKFVLLSFHTCVKDGKTESRANLP